MQGSQMNKPASEQLVNLSLYLNPKTSKQPLRQNFRLDVFTSRQPSIPYTLHLKLRDATYLWAWLQLNGEAPRFASRRLGLLKAGCYASLLVSEILPPFRSELEAYNFYKARFNPPSLRSLLGENVDEQCLRLEKGLVEGVGGYLGGLTESKDKTQCKAALSEVLPGELVRQLLPSPVLKENGKREANKFYFSAPHYTIKKGQGYV